MRCDGFVKRPDIGPQASGRCLNKAIGQYRVWKQPLAAWGIGRAAYPMSHNYCESCVKGAGERLTIQRLVAYGRD